MTIACRRRNGASGGGLGEMGAGARIRDSEGRSPFAAMASRDPVFSDIALEGSATSEMTGWAERRPGVARL